MAPKARLRDFHKSSSFLFGLRHAHFAGAVLFANGDDPLAPARPGPASQSVQFDDQRRARIERKTEMIRRLDGLRDELVHHFQRAGNDAGAR